MTNYHAAGTFIGIWYEERSAIALLNWATSQGLTDITELDNVHTTLHYSRKGSRAASRVSGSKIFTVETGELELLGFNHDILAVRIESPELERLHLVMKEKYNLEYDFAVYKPHITIKYDFKGNIEDLELPNMQLATTGIRVMANKLKIKS